MWFCSLNLYIPICPYFILYSASYYSSCHVLFEVLFQLTEPRLRSVQIKDVGAEGILNLVVTLMVIIVILIIVVVRTIVTIVRIIVVRIMITITVICTPLGILNFLLLLILPGFILGHAAEMEKRSVNTV